MTPHGLLVARLAAGDERALAEVLDEFGPAVLAAAAQILHDTVAAQDVLQDVIVGLWCHPQRYDPALGSLRYYLAMCARHRALDVLRGEQRRAGREAHHHRLHPAAAGPAPADEVIDAQSAAAVRKAVRTLPDDQRRAVELAYFGGMSYREVARVLGVPEGTAKSRVRLALARLAATLDHDLLESP